MKSAKPLRYKFVPQIGFNSESFKESLHIETVVLNNPFEPAKELFGINILLRTNEVARMIRQLSAASIEGYNNDGQGIVEGPNIPMPWEGWPGLRINEVNIGNAGSEFSEIWDKFYLIEFLSRLGHSVLEAVTSLNLLEKNGVTADLIADIMKSLSRIDAKLELYYGLENYVPIVPRKGTLENFTIEFETSRLERKNGHYQKYLIGFLRNREGEFRLNAVDFSNHSGSTNIFIEMSRNMTLQQICDALESTSKNQGYTWIFADLSNSIGRQISFEIIESESYSKVKIQLRQVEGRLAGLEEIWDNFYFTEYMSRLGHKALEAVTWFDLKSTGEVNQEWINSIKNSLERIDERLDAYYVDDSYIASETQKLNLPPLA